MAVRYWLLYLVIGTLFIADRVIKYWFINHPSFSWDFVTGIIGFNFSPNRGIAFGIPINTDLLLGLITITLLILINLLVRAYRHHQPLVVVALTCIIAGAASNLIDRLRYGFVIDYIDVTFFTVFNLADVLITIGAITLALVLLVKKDLLQPLDKSTKVL